MKSLAMFMVMGIVIACCAGAGSTTRPAEDVASVKRGTIEPSIELDGHLQAIDPVEIRIRPKAYAGELTIVSAAEPGAVKKGQLLLELDARPLKLQLAAAENELAAAKANLAKEESDVVLGDRSDALAMQGAQRELDNAVAGLKWWDDLDGKQTLQNSELAAKNAKAEVEDQQDELDQLKKMYKSEELTSATADIVVKRAIRRLETSRVAAGMWQDRAGKVKQFDLPTTRERLVMGIEEQKQKVASLKALQDQQRVLRQTTLVTARAAAEKAETKVEDLKADAKLMRIESPAAGVLFYGQCEQGTWQNTNRKSFAEQEKITAGLVVMTVFTPGRLRAVVDVPEAKSAWIGSGDRARVIPVARPGAVTSGKCAAPSRVGVAREGGAAYPTQIELESVAEELTPGQRISVSIEQATLKNVLVVPSSAISRGRVKVYSGGQESWREVIVGKSSAEQTQIVSGLKDGEQVVRKP